MMQDGVYDHSKPREIVDNGPKIRYDYMGPFEDTQDALISRAIMSVTLPAAMIQDIVRPNLPQIQLFRPKFGYRTEELTIMDIVDVNIEYQPTRTDYSQSPTSYQGTSRNVTESVW
jgi:hypothetical protein